MKKIIFIALSSILILSCGRFNNKENNDKKDMRIVCVSKQLTEFLFALGKGHDIVAVDESSTYPDSAKLLKTVGYHRMLSVEGIISMEPDLVVHDNDMGPATVLPQLEKAGLKIQAFDGGKTMDSAQLLMTELGKYFHAEAVADSINKKWSSDIQQLAATQKAMVIKDTPSVVVIQYGRVVNDYFIMSGRGGTVDKMIEMAGGKVAKYDAKGAKTISAEALATANPDIIIATDFGFDRMGSVDKFKTIPGVALTNAAKNNRIYRFEENSIVYFGPRTPGNSVKLMNLFYPQTNASKK